MVIVQLIYRFIPLKRDDSLRGSLRPIYGKEIQVIRKMRNAQLTNLRQKHPLTPADQSRYFRKLFDLFGFSQQPEHILMSWYYPSFRGYLALVHLNWQRREAEVSSLLSEVEEEELQGYRHEFQCAHLKLIAFARSIGIRTLVAEVFAHRREVRELLKDIGFKEHPTHLLRNGRRIRTSHRSTVLQLDIRQFYETRKPTT